MGTEREWNGYRTGTKQEQERVQNGYRMRFVNGTDTEWVQNGNGTDTERVQNKNRNACRMGTKLILSCVPCLVSSDRYCTCDLVYAPV